MIIYDLSEFSWTEAFAILKPLSIFIIGVVIYSVFIFKFYRFLGRKDILELNLNQYDVGNGAFVKKFFRVFFYIIENLLLFPLFIFFWFAILTTLLTFLSKDPRLENIFLVSMALVASIRITAYYNEDLSRDLAKMLPFAMLGVFLIDISFFSFKDSLAILWNVGEFWKLLIYYLGFAIALEFILRMATGTINYFKKSE